MSSPLWSSRKQKDDQETVAGLSPEKYGSAAYLDLSYSPSLLADNVLFREAASLKRIEEEAKKSREFEARSENLTDQVGYLRKERDGISESLNSIISMYKEIISQMETKSQERHMEIQKKYAEEVERNIASKEEEAKYFQAEKEALESRIQAIEGVAQQTQKLLEESQNQNAQLEKDIERVERRREEESKRAEKAEKEVVEERKKGEEAAQRLRREHMEAEVAWKAETNQKIHEKEKEIANIQISHKNEVERTENRKQQELALKTQEMNEIRKTFQTEVRRQEEMNKKKDDETQVMKEESRQLQDKILSMTTEYEKEITHLTHEKSRLMQEIDKLNTDCQILREMNPSALAVENGQLRDLLMESSAELERSKSEMVILAKDNNSLARQLTAAETEAKSWQDSYYLARTRLY